MLIFFISNVLYGNFSCLASVWFIIARLYTENARESGSVDQQPEDHHQPLSTTITNHQPSPTITENAWWRRGHLGPGSVHQQPEDHQRGRLWKQAEGGLVDIHW